MPLAVFDRVPNLIHRNPDALNIGVFCWEPCSSYRLTLAFVL
jgi:hypothetical protein